MKTELQIHDEEVKPIFEEIKTLINTSRAKAYYAVNKEMLNLHLKVVKRIFEIQEGKDRATYGNTLIPRNLLINSLLYERLTLSQNKDKILELSKEGQIIKTSKDLIKDPLVLEFLDIKENTDYLESDLEKNILSHLKEFMLELGKGFMFVGSQTRITLDDRHFYPDLIFYNRILRCFVIIDLKIGEISHQNIGQMQMYVNYYDRKIKKYDENKTVGILLSTKKNETIVRYTLSEDNKTIFLSEYKLHLPVEQELINTVEKEKYILRLQFKDDKIS